MSAVTVTSVRPSQWRYRLHSAIPCFGRDWAAPILAWAIFCGMALATVCVLLAPFE